MLPLSWWEDRLAGGGERMSAVIGARDDGELIGVVGLSIPRRMKTRHKAWLFGMYVRAGMRHMGTGVRLVEAAVRLAEEQDGVRLLQLTVTEGNVEAEGLYHRFGFRRFGLEPLALADGDELLSKVHMWLPLHGPSSTE